MLVHVLAVVSRIHPLGPVWDANGRIHGLRPALCLTGEVPEDVVAEPEDDEHAGEVEQEIEESVVDA